MATSIARKIALGLILACAATPAAQAEEVSVTILAHARTVCTADLSASAPARLEAGQTMLGSIRELCNDVEGYRIVLTHPRGLVGAAVMLDGQRVPIATDASETVIVDAPHDGQRQRQFGLELAEAVDGLQLGLIAEPKGMTF